MTNFSFSAGKHHPRIEVIFVRVLYGGAPRKEIIMAKRLTAVFMALLIVAITATTMAASAINKDGYYKGIKLCGKVKVVDHFPDIKVKIVDSFPDLRVKTVEHFPNHIGEWQFVEYGEDFTVQFVESFPDIKIKYVNSFPGVE